MKKVILILCLCFVFTSFAAENTTPAKTSTKTTVENVVSKKKVVKTRGKTENNTKWTNWSKIKDLFM